VEEVPQSQQLLQIILDLRSILITILQIFRKAKNLHLWEPLNPNFTTLTLVSPAIRIPFQLKLIVPLAALILLTSNLIFVKKAILATKKKLKIVFLQVVKTMLIAL